jgi:hypothetical protein
VVNEAHFAQARPVFDPSVLSVAAGAGLDPAAVGEVLHSHQYADEVQGLHLVGPSRTPGGPAEGITMRMKRVQR